MLYMMKSVTRICITVVLTLIILICMKQSNSFKEKFYKVVYESNFNFAQINSLYQDYFGSSFPFKKWLDTKPVFKEALTYSEKADYLDGVKLTVGADYLVPVLKSGLVVFVGEKEGYGKVIVIEQLDGVDCWYGNLSTMNVGLYDYIETGSLLGTVQEHLYLVYKKNGEKLDYKEYM